MTWTVRKQNNGTTPKLILVGRVCSLYGCNAVRETESNIVSPKSVATTTTVCCYCFCFNVAIFPDVENQKLKEINEKDSRRISN